MDFVYEPIFDENNRVAGIFVEGSNETKSYQAQEKLRELDETLEKRVEERTRELRIAEEALSPTPKGWRL